MKLGSTESKSEEKSILGEMVELAGLNQKTPDAPPKMLNLSDVLDEAAAEASNPSEEIEVAFSFDEKAKKFWKTYRFSATDIGLTPFDVFQQLENSDRVPDEDEEKILDSLIFIGRYRETFRLGKKGSFELTTISSKMERLIRRRINEGVESDPSGFTQTFNAMAVARCLVSFNDKPTCDIYDPKDPKFEDEEQFDKRLDFALSLPIEVLDAMGASVNRFMKKTSGVMARSLKDF